MLHQLVKNRVGAVAGMNGDIGVDKVCQDRATPSIPLAQRNIDRLPLFDAGGLWHAAQGGDPLLQTIASGKDCNDVTQSRDFEIDNGIGIGKLGRNAHSLAVAGFEHTGPRHRNSLLEVKLPLQDIYGDPMCQSVYIRRVVAEVAGDQRLRTFDPLALSGAVHRLSPIRAGQPRYTSLVIIVSQRFGTGRRR
jgi:hypothetical protein